MNIKTISVFLSILVLGSTLYGETKLSQFHGLLTDVEMSLLQGRVEALSQDKALSQSVDFFTLSCFGLDKSKSNVLYLGSATRKQIDSGDKVVIDNQALRIHLEASFLPARAKNRLKMDYELLSGNLYPIPLAKAEKGVDFLTAHKSGSTYLSTAVPEPIFNYDLATLSTDLITLDSRVDAARFWIVAISRHTRGPRSIEQTSSQ